MAIGIGVFGYGFIAKVHLEALRRIPEFTVHGVCGPHPERARVVAAPYAIPLVTSDPEELLQHPAIDAVLVDTPDGDHGPLVLAAAAHSKHIFCEKPLAMTLDEARAMVAATQRAGVRTLMGFSNRWNPLFVHVRGLLDRDAMGTIYHVHSQNFNAGLLSPMPRSSWHTDPTRTGSGILGDLGSHAVDLIHYLLGPISDVCASMRTCRSPLYDPVTDEPRPARLDDDVNLLLRLANGAEGTMALSRLGAAYSDFPIGHRQLLIDGSEAGLAYADGHARLYRPDHTWEVLPSDTPPPGTEHAEFLIQGAVRTMHTFLEAIRDGHDLAPTLEDGLRCQAVLQAAIESSRSRSWVAVPQV